MNAYIFLGPETGKKQDEIDKIRKKLSANGALEETVFYAGETPGVAIANAVLNPSLFSPSRLFIIKNAGSFGGHSAKDREEAALIASCAKGIDRDTALILTSDEFKLASGLDDCVPKENRKIFYEMFENEKSEWLRDFFRREGFRIDAGGIDTILELVENNTDAMRRECLRLTLFLPKDRAASAEDVEKWLSHSREESAFTLFSRIAAGDVSRSIETLRALLAAKESATGILATLAWCFRKLRDYSALLKNGGEPGSFELKKIGVSSPKARADYQAASRIYSSAAIDACLALTAEYDILTRSLGSPFEAVLMDAYIVKIMGVRE